MEPELYNFINAAITTSPLLGIVFILWKAGVLEAVAKKIRGNANDHAYTISTSILKRLKNLESFKHLAETNHFHDLDNVMEEIKEMRRDMKTTDVAISNIKERVAIIETKIEAGSAVTTY